MENKIFVDAHAFDGEYQGTLTYLKELYLKIIQINPAIKIYFGANNVKNVKKHFGKFNNVEFIQYNSKHSLKRIFIEIPKIIDALECTHAHFQYVIPFIKNKKCKYIVTIHDILFNDFSNEFSFLYRIKRNFLFRLTAKRCDFLLTVSNYSKQKISEQYKIDTDNIMVTPNAISEDYFEFNHTKVESRNYINSKYGISNYILYVSRIEPRKNQVLLLNTFLNEKLWLKGYQLALIGSNTLKSGLLESIDKLEMEVRKSIHWIEQVDDSDLKQFLNGAEIFVYPSKAEGFGIPPLEAGALFTPVLCSNVTAMVDFDFFKPYFFNPDNKIEFDKLFLEIIENKEKINLEEIHDIIKVRYSWEQSARVLLEKVLKA
ncbi:glycosyltransferase family 4 protein [Winogradskyella helgolandensis]|uniref:glycosyltransferase family 4 protein n=1 Tax=Winogradskyella helgolandensis TaxID=2697010 RepID=UPI0015CC545A|nr:glycosyltransferase family 1 protein [Winogradskyella helgolandensis]